MTGSYVQKIKQKKLLRLVHRDENYIMVGRAYKRLVNNIVQSLKPVFGKKLLGKLMLASNTSKKIIT